MRINLYVIDRNLTLECRGAQFHFDQLPKLVDELLASRVDVIVPTCYPAAAAAQQGTKQFQLCQPAQPPSASSTACRGRAAISPACRK
jgi:hypothetical protein